VAVASFEFDLEHNPLDLQAELHAHTYRPGSYTNFTIHERKRPLVQCNTYSVLASPAFADIPLPGVRFQRSH
jgi:hypothetical protein